MVNVIARFKNQLSDFKKIYDQNNRKTKTYAVSSRFGDQELNKFIKPVLERDLDRHGKPKLVYKLNLP